jgi:hypothetical protein
MPQKQKSPFAKGLFCFRLWLLLAGFYSAALAGNCSGVDNDILLSQLQNSGGALDFPF